MATWSFDDSWTSSEEIVAYIDRTLSRSLSLPFFFLFLRRAIHNVPSINAARDVC